MDEDDSRGADHADDVRSGGRLDLIYSFGLPFKIDPPAGTARKSGSRSKNMNTRLDEDDK